MCSPLVCLLEHFHANENPRIVTHRSMIQDKSSSFSLSPAPVHSMHQQKATSSLLEMAATISILAPSEFSFTLETSRYVGTELFYGTNINCIRCTYALKLWILRGYLERLIEARTDRLNHVIMRSFPIPVTESIRSMFPPSIFEDRCVDF